MSITDTIRRAGPYATNGSQTVFPFAFKVFEPADVVVTSSTDGIDTTLVLTTDYTVMLNSDQDSAPGGSITTTSTLNGPEITITSGVAATQPAVFTNSGGFYPRVLNDNLDRGIIVSQQILEKLSRTPLLPLGQPPVGQFPVVLPDGSFGWSTGSGGDSGLRADLGTDAPGKGVSLVAGALTAKDVVLSPRQFGATGVGDDTAALQAFLNALGDGVHGRWDGGPYTISGRLTLIGKDNFHISGQCTIKMADGAATNENYSILLAQACTNFVIEGLTADGNRDNRTPAEASGHLIRVIGGRAGLFRRCMALNATTDGWYVRGSNPADLATYPVDMVFEDCGADNAYRNGMAIIGAVRPKVIRGSYSGSNGTAPEAGIDSEPNVTDVHGVIDLEVIDTDVSNNGGSGLFLTGNTGSGVTRNARVSGLSGSGNNGVGGGAGYGAFIHLSASEGAVIENVKCGDHPDFAPSANRGLIHISANSLGAVVNGATFVGITNNRSNVYCVMANSGSVSPIVRNITCDAVACGAVNFLPSNGVLSGVSVNNSSFAGISIQITGSGNTTSDLKVTDHAGTYSIYANCPFITARNWRVVDGVSATAQIRFDSASLGADIDGLTVHQTIAVPSGYAVRLDAAPASLRNLTATKTNDATGSWTASNLLFTSSGLLAASTVSGTSPDVLGRSVTVDPPSVAAAGSESFTITLAKASVGDAVLVTPPYDLQGLVCSASVLSNGVVTVFLSNPTAGAVNLASGAWKVSLLKS